MRWLFIQLAVILFALDALSRTLLPTHVQAASDMPDSRFLTFGDGELNIVDYKNPSNVKVIKVASGLGNEWYMFSLIDVVDENYIFAATSILNPGVSLIKIRKDMTLEFLNSKQYPFGQSERQSYGVAGRNGHFLATSSFYIPPQGGESIQKDIKETILTSFRNNIVKFGYCSSFNFFAEIKETYHNASTVEYWSNKNDEYPEKTWLWRLYNHAPYPVAMAKTRIMVAVYLDRELRLFLPSSDKPIATYEVRHDFKPSSLAFDNEDKYLALGGLGKVIIFDVENLKVKHQIDFASPSIVSSIQFSEDGKRLYCGVTIGQSSIVELDVEKGTIVRDLKFPIPVNVIVFSTNTHFAFLGSAESSIYPLK